MYISIISLSAESPIINHNNKHSLFKQGVFRGNKDYNFLQVKKMFRSSCHTHTLYCDGKNTAREMVEAAISKGFISLGFSGHSPMKQENEWTMSVDDTQKYIAEINTLKEEFSDKIDILCGIELDSYFCGINPDDFDYVIGSVHQFEKDGTFYDIDYTAEHLKKAVDVAFGGSFNKMSKSYYSALADFIISTKVDVVGHIDLITKFNLDTFLFEETDEEYRSYALEAVDRIITAKPDILFEVNTGAMFRVGKKTPYPAPFILRHIFEKGGRVTLTSDSHSIESIDFAFEEAVEFIKKIGFEEIFYLTKSGIKSIKIEELYK